ncbi:MAG: 16S rRNA (cytosine(1402)-N(4))-methyltransferase RsmH [Alphaproteobacteria bacterium]|nr:16S rRNA (cytosine(1402)-N(4))-methyltransferase RsmH [Alphaproteobacteria bacterium]TAD91654.1 MAG: 16S rRNA (cytosine(1402)-N(4))-methyltransferase RsmH [Alphaproteobacteria bacterium]
MSDHVPVLLQEVVAALAPRAGGIYLDGTFGRGGYASALLAAAPCRVVGIDRDPAAIAFGRSLPAVAEGRLTLVEGCFGAMADIARDLALPAVDGVALDLGVSSPQLDQAERGFSFRADGPLDMRMGQHGTTAADLVAELSEGDLADVIYQFGEERFSRRIARAIVAARQQQPILTTLMLAEIVRRAVGRTSDGIDPATRTFQALRIAVNDELGEVDRGLAGAEAVLAPGGRLAVVSFHSLEDRRVKTFLAERSQEHAGGSRHLPAAPVRRPTFRLVTRKPITASPGELAANPRSRSAKLRVAERRAA